MRVTQRDIASMAGVSQATVSRVLAEDGRVEEAIRKRVRQAMREHNYKPDVRARALRSQRTGLLGLVVKRLHGGLSDDPFFGALTGAIVERLSGQPYHLCVDMAHSDLSHEALYDEMLRSRRVDGLVLVESEARDERIVRLQQDRFPFVVIGNPAHATGVLSVDNDNVHAGEVAARHLRENGYRKIGFIGARKGVTVSDDRIEGFLGAGGDPTLVRYADFGASAAREAARALLLQAKPDALVVLDDFMAMGVVGAARELGLGIPRDLGIVGFNDTALCGLLEGGLSSVSLDMPQLVSLALDRLLDVIERGETPAEPRTIVEAKLVARGSSCGPASISAPGSSSGSSGVAS